MPPFSTPLFQFNRPNGSFRQIYGAREDGEFFLSHGGFIDRFSMYGEAFTRPTAGQPPMDLTLVD